MWGLSAEDLGAEQRMGNLWYSASGRPCSSTMTSMDTWLAPASWCSRMRPATVAMSPHRDHRVDQTVAPTAANVVVAVAECPQVVGIVGKVQVCGSIPRELPGPCRFRLEHDSHPSTRSVPGPRMPRARMVCSTGTKYGSCPAARSEASWSMRGPRAASTRRSGGTGTTRASRASR